MDSAMEGEFTGTNVLMERSDVMIVPVNRMIGTSR
jgi:hypothetical protein